MITIENDEVELKKASREELSDDARLRQLTSFMDRLNSSKNCNDI